MGVYALVAYYISLQYISSCLIFLFLLFSVLSPTVAYCKTANNASALLCDDDGLHAMEYSYIERVKTQRWIRFEVVVGIVHQSNEWFVIGNQFESVSIQKRVKLFDPKHTSQAFFFNLKVSLF